MNKQSIYNTIYKRAIERGITIERGPKHRCNLDHTGGGIRFVYFPNNKKIYKYRDTLVNIAIRIGLITEKEYEEYLLQNSKLQRCSRCNRVTEVAIVKHFGHCLNC